jgi:serine phosphatase RsbU (regulator of sigma subunit)
LAPDGGSAAAACAAPGEAVLFDLAALPFPTGWLTEPIAVGAERFPREWQRLLSPVSVVDRRWHVIPISDGRGVAGLLATAAPVGADRLPEADANLLQQLADAMRVALGNLRAFTEEHRIALTLQRALLPGVLPDVGSLSFAARYLAASDGVSVGGDFYDVFELPSGQLAVVIGDVQGHSLQAATVMAELRFSLRAYLAEQHHASSALSLLDAMLQRNHPDDTATVALLLLDAEATHADLANAGHLPPLLVTPGAACYLEASGTLLGATDAPRVDVRVELPGDCCLVLVTDGLVERRGESLGTALERLRGAVLGVGTLDPDRIADALLDQFVVPSADDDIAVLVVRVSR